jgi:CRP-like cAMP-binding protein
MHEQKALHKAPLAQKVAREIVNLIERYGDEGETFLPIPITRQEIADSVGASVESVIRVMSDWSQNGYLKTTDQVIHVLRMDKILEVMMG